MARLSMADEVAISCAITNRYLDFFDRLSGIDPFLDKAISDLDESLCVFFESYGNTRLALVKYCLNRVYDITKSLDYTGRHPNIHARIAFMDREILKRCGQLAKNALDDETSRNDD